MDNQNMPPEIPEENGNITVKKNKTADFIAKIGCVFVAFIIWFYVMSVENPMYEKEFYQIPINIINNGQLSVLSGSTSYIDITVKGKRSIVNKMTKENIDAFVDISSELAAGRHTVDVSINLPNGVNLVSSSPESVSLMLDNTSSISLPVQLKLTDYILDDGFELGESDATLSVNTVTVIGPASDLANLDCARLSVKLGHVTRSVTYRGSLELVDKSGNVVSNSYLSLQTKEASVTVPVYKYRTIPIKFNYKHGYFNDSNIKIVPTPSEILIKGEVDAVDKADWSYTINEKVIAGDGNYILNVDLPNDVINVDGISAINVNIALLNTSTKSIVIDKFNVINPNGLKYELQKENVSVLIRGETSLLNYITAASIKATIDLSSLKNVSGTILVPISFYFDGVYDQNVYELDSYSIPIKITA